MMAPSRRGGSSLKRRRPRPAVALALAVAALAYFVAAYRGVGPGQPAPLPGVLAGAAGLALLFVARWLQDEEGGSG